ncbi:hypothetical protein ABD91_25960 [Lysinibacillus sphaericus]|uniref:hypothetical protein n=1 Tax=Lysinibacillus sphaericus TaxID=1421 RepID=UPI0018CFC848|nr:hypothetical protein [Lysinibacillus sphaericus]MBG9694180.1 hypothetical protein [Lysinibacillus sphaericus]
MKIEKDSRVSRTMYRKRLIFLNRVMAAFLLIVVAFQLIGCSKVIERNSHNAALESMTFEKTENTSVGEIVQYN